MHAVGAHCHRNVDAVIDQQLGLVAHAGLPKTTSQFQKIPRVEILLAQLYRIDAAGQRRFYDIN